MQKQTQGFTLIEISIVLVIIGLLAGGILKGQQMIENAKYKAFVKDIDAIRASVNSFQDRYKYLPGDFPSASSQLSAGGAVILNGNGDGKITVGSCNNVEYSPEEVCFAWQHLIAAGLLTGDASLISPTNAPRPTPVGGVYKNIYTGAWSTANHALMLITENIPGSVAQRLDSEFDDGKALSGKIVCYSGGNSNTAADCGNAAADGGYQPNITYFQVLITL